MKKIVLLLVLLLMTITCFAENRFEKIAKEVADNMGDKKQPEYVLILKEDYDNFLHLRTQLVNKIQAVPDNELGRYFEYLLGISKDTIRQITRMEYNHQEPFPWELPVKERDDQFNYLRDKISLLEMKCNYLQAQLNEFQNIKGGKLK